MQNTFNSLLRITSKITAWNNLSSLGEKQARLFVVIRNVSLPHNKHQQLLLQVVAWCDVGSFDPSYPLPRIQWNILPPSDIWYWLPRRSSQNLRGFFFSKVRKFKSFNSLEDGFTPRLKKPSQTSKMPRCLSLKRSISRLLSRKV